MPRQVHSLTLLGVLTHQPLVQQATECNCKFHSLHSTLIDPACVFVCLSQAVTAEWQRRSHHDDAVALKDTAANAVLSLPANMSASEPYLAVQSTWQNPYAVLPTTPAHAVCASPYSTDMSAWKADDLQLGHTSLSRPFSDSSTSPRHCPGRNSVVSAQLEEAGSSPAIPQQPHTVPKSPVAKLHEPPATSMEGFLGPGYSSQQHPSAHHDQKSARVPPQGLSFSTHQQCQTTPGQFCTAPWQFPSSPQQDCLAALQQREWLFGPPLRPSLNPQQNLTSSHNRSHMSPQQLQEILWCEPLLQRAESTSNALSHQHIYGSHQSCVYRDGTAGAQHASAFQAGRPCFESRWQALGQQQDYGTNVSATPYIPT